VDERELLDKLMRGVDVPPLPAETEDVGESEAPPFELTPDDQAFLAQVIDLACRPGNIGLVVAFNPETERMKYLVLNTPNVRRALTMVLRVAARLNERVVSNEDGD
jgi:hypothetical protein